MHETAYMSDHMSDQTSDQAHNRSLADNRTGQTEMHLTTGTPTDSGVPVVHMDQQPAERFPIGATLPYDRVTYGPEIPDESALRLLGNLDAKRVLELGSGDGHAAVAMATKGARVISVDPSAERLDAVRAACERAEVKVETHHNDLADLAFVRADTIDVVVSIYALAGVDDLDRVFRQVHRVLHTGCVFVMSFPHPVWTMIDKSSEPIQITGSYFSTGHGSSTSPTSGVSFFPRTISDIFTSLVRANFRVDTLLEPSPANGSHGELWNDAMKVVPSTLIVRARKEGN